MPVTWKGFLPGETQPGALCLVIWTNGLWTFGTKKRHLVHQIFPVLFSGGPIFRPGEALDARKKLGKVPALTLAPYYILDCSKNRQHTVRVLVTSRVKQKVL